MFIPTKYHMYSQSPMAMAMSMYHVYSSFPYGYEFYGYMCDLYNHPML
jgi:ABC-type thiamin/hydroxymethylpyrimidine transport system permease subunit